MRDPSEEEEEVAAALLGGARGDDGCPQCGRPYGLFVVEKCYRSICSRCVTEKIASVRQKRPDIPHYGDDHDTLGQVDPDAPYLWLSTLESEALRELRQQQRSPPQATLEIKRNLEADIEEILGNESVVLILNDPSAPVVTISRRAADARNVVPVLFMAGTHPNPQLVYQRSGGLTPIFHSLAGARTERFLVFPYLYNRFDDPSRFRSVLTRICGSLDRWSAMAWTISDCHVEISENG